MPRGPRVRSDLGCLLALILAACGDELLLPVADDAGSDDVGGGADASGAPDAGALDAGAPDAQVDAGLPADAGITADASCRAQIDPSPNLDSSTLISDPNHAALVPVLAARADRALVAWHEFVGTGTSAVRYVLIHDGCLGVERGVPEQATIVQRPSLAVTPDGFVLAYHVQEPTGLAVHALWLDENGDVISGPETISGAAGGSYARVTSNGPNTAFGWIAGGAHHYALRGPGETVLDTTTGVPLLSQVVLNTPKLALDSVGTLYIGYRDGGTTGADWDALLISRPRAGSFGAPRNLSQSPGLLSDDLALAIEADDRLNVAWVEQDPIDVNSFEVEYSVVTTGVASAPARFATQGLWSWSPSLSAGLNAVWHTGTSGWGPIVLAEGPNAPRPILSGLSSDGVSLARAPNGSLHLAIGEHATTRAVRYTWRR